MYLLCNEYTCYHHITTDEYNYYSKCTYYVITIL